MAKKVKQPVTRDMTIADAISEAWGVLEELASDMREAYDNTPESLQSSAVGEARGEAADALEGLSEPNVPDEIGKREFTYVSFPPPKRQSRSDRRDEATSLLDAVIQELDDEALADDEDAEALRTEVENLKDEAEAVEFPGMRG